MKVSVITPFYNTESYLAEAIESVLGQTCGDFEYILQDNRSTDGSRAIAEDYARRDPRVRVVGTTEFFDQDTNFSQAFRQISAESRYAKMVLADDWLFPRCLEDMVAVAEAHPSVGLVSSYYLEGTILKGFGLKYPSTFVSGHALARLQLQKGWFFFGSPTTVMYRSEVVRGTFPFYDPAVPNADTEACYRTLRDWDFGFVHQVLSFLRVEESSRMGLVQDYFPGGLSRFIVVNKFGRDFLDAGEFATALRAVNDDYLRDLGDALLTRRDPEFWSFHRAGLATIGYEIRWRRLWKYVLLALVDLCFNPKKTVGRIVRRLRAKRGAPAER